MPMPEQAIRGFTCEICGDRSLMYNGNYFCWNPNCWVMDCDIPTDQERTRDLLISWTYMWDRRLTSDNWEEQQRLTFYIDPIERELEKRGILSTVHDPKSCQYCRLIFPSTSEKGVHATLAHPRQEPLKFAACEACGARTYLALGTCQCGNEMTRAF